MPVKFADGSVGLNQEKTDSSNPSSNVLDRGFSRSDSVWRY